MTDYRSKYELDLAYLAKENEKYMLRKIEKRVKELMSTKSDYASWFYKPATAGYIRNKRETYRTVIDKYDVAPDNPKLDQCCHHYFLLITVWLIKLVNR